MHLLYSLLTGLAMIMLLPYFLVRGLREGKHAHSLGQRLGFLPDVSKRLGEGSAGTIWVHAVSVGEVLAALPLGRRLMELFPERKLVVSTTTRTGQIVARERMGFAHDVFYFPLDWAWCVRRTLRAVRPGIVVILETEIWPNFLRETRRTGVPVVFVNGRISDRSFRGYRRVNGFLGGFVRRVLNDGALFLMQSREDADRLLSLGVAPERVSVTGNLKYDLQPPSPGPFVCWLQAQVEQQERRPLAVAGSVVEEEEEQILAAYDILSRQWRRALLVLAPRKPDRFDAAAEIVCRDGWSLMRRSALSPDSQLDENTEVILLDTVGELAGLYGLADVVFVGGSLVPSGGHNILEPAWFSRAPVFGPSMENFRAIAQQFLASRAALQVSSGEELGEAWVKLVKDKPWREAMGEAARALVERNRGATERAVEQLVAVLQGNRR